MEKLFVYFKADDQQLVCCNPFRVSSKKIAYVEAHFDLGENWTGYDSVRAIWRNTQNFAIIGTVLDSQGICKVPTEVLTSIGQVDVNLVGSISENNVLTDRLTTYPVEAGRVDANALVDGSETAEITPSQFEQFAAAVRNDAERAREGAEDAEGYADAAAGSAEAAAGSAQSAADDAQRIAQMIQDVIEQIEDFYGVTVSVETLPAGSQATARYEEGHLYLGIPKGEKGDTGNGIASITKTGTSGLVDTYTIAFTSGQTTTFAVTNGEKGDTGNGIASITKTGTSGLVDTYTITYTDGQTETFTITNGEKGDTGNGIDRIELTSTSGYVKTYSIYFTDGSTTTFEVTDGEVSLEDYYKLFIEDAASGSIASFPDGADDIPMISVLANIEPVQDLHGYDKPWPAGGGKNKFDVFKLVPSANLVISADGTITVTGTAVNGGKRLRECANVTEGETYILTASTTGASNFVYLYGTNTSWYFGTQRTLTESDLNSYVFFYGGAGTTATIKDFMIRKSTETDSSYAPYSNICPISGHTECVTSVSPYEQTEKHTITGKNLYDAPNNQNGVLVPCHIENGQTVVASCGSNGAGVRYYDANKTQIDYWTLTLQANGRYYRSFTASGGIEYVEFYGANSTNYMIEVGASTPSDYEPYGNSHTTSLGRTVYGGTLDVVSGVLTVDRAYGLVNRASNKSEGSSGYFWYSTISDLGIPPIKDTSANLISDRLLKAYNTTQTMAEGCITIYANGIVRWKEQGSMTLTEYRAYLAENPITVCYELATPQTYQLTPQQIDSLLGINNVWADTGDVTVKYRADTKLYIDKVLAS